MRRSESIALGALVTLAQSVCAPALDGPKPLKPVPRVAVSPAPASESGKPVALASSDLGGLNALLPVGKTARKVVVPSVDEEGVLTSVTRMGKITRIDEDRFALENVVLTTFDVEKLDPATGRPEATVVKISKGVYVASEKKLVSDRAVRISKPRLEMTGESLVYWSVEGRAVLKGNTEAILTDLETPAPTPAEPAPQAPEPEGSAPGGEENQPPLDSDPGATPDPTPEPGAPPR